MMELHCGKENYFYLCTPFWKKKVHFKNQEESMNTLSYKTISANAATVTKDWVLIDAEDQILGRLAAKVAMLLKGKTKTNYTPHVDCGDNVVIINAEKIRLTGNKMEDKIYLTHSGYPGGQKEVTPSKLLARKPTAVVEKAIKGMLPKNRLGRDLFRNLYVYAGPDHLHTAQQPKPMKLTSIK
jgi:large subunit ribosomal protein L13